jgi:chromosome partitioning protein
MGSGVDKRTLPHSVYDVLLEDATIAEARATSPKGGYDVLGANRELAGAEIELVTLERRDRRLKTAIEAAAADYDFVLIDCPPSLSLLTLNGLTCAHGVIVPMQCEYYALEGLSALLATIEQIRAAVNEHLELEGILRTMFDPRNNLANEVSAQLIMHFGEKVFRTLIPRNIRLAEAPSFGKPVLFHDKESRGALAYLALAGEMIRREEEAREHPKTALAATAPSEVPVGEQTSGPAAEEPAVTGAEQPAGRGTEGPPAAE